MSKKLRLAVVLMALCILTSSFSVTAAKKYVKLDKYCYDKSVVRVAKAIGGMKVTSTKKYKSYCYKKNLKIGILADALNKYSGEIDRYQQITDIKNTGNKQVIFNGVRIGDSYAKVKKIFLKNGNCNLYKKYIFTWGNSSTMKTKFKKGKLVSYTWECRYTG